MRIEEDVTNLSDIDVDEPNAGNERMKEEKETGNVSCDCMVMWVISTCIKNINKFVQ